MKIDKDIIFFIAALAFLIGFFVVNPTYTGFQIVNNSPDLTPEIEIVLSQDKFTPAQLIDGVVIINLTGTIYSSDKITATVEGITSEKSLVDIIKALNVPHRQFQQTVYTGDNPESSKTLTFNSAGFSAVGINLRKGAAIDTFDLSIKGTSHNGNYPTYPQLDLGAKGIYNDWEYFGEIDGYETQAIIASGLEESNTEYIATISNPSRIECKCF